jgi:tetratricopeptide (TPR) repeat protein
MATKKYRCTNLAACDKALSQEILEVPEGQELVCTECGKPLEVIPDGDPGGRRKKVLILAGAFLTLIAGVATWALWPRNQYPPEPPLPAQGQTADTSKEAADKAGQQQGQRTYACGLKPVDQPDVNRMLTYLKQGMIYASQRQYELALKEFEQVQHVDPNFLAMHENIAAAQLKLKRLPEAEDHLKKESKLIACLEQMPDDVLPKFAYMIEVGRKAQGEADMARAKTMRERLKQARAVAHYNMACVRSLQGTADLAIVELRQAVGNGFSDVSALKRDPDLSRARSAPEFQEVLAAASQK